MLWENIWSNIREISIYKLIEHSFLIKKINLVIIKGCNNMFEDQNYDREKVNSIKKLRKYLYIIMVFDVILSFKGIPKEESILSIICLVLLILSGIICGIINFKVTDKKGVSIVIGVLSLFVMANVFVTGNVIYKTNDYLKNNEQNTSLE